MSDGDLISVSDLIGQLLHNELRVSEDSLQRLRDLHLIPKPKSMGRKGSGYQPAQVEHIRRVLCIQKDLGPKWTYEELAFWMAAWKLRNVPAPLVAEHIKRGTMLFLNGLERLADRSATGRRGGGGSPARRMARFAIRQLLHAANGQLNNDQTAVMLDIAEFIINLVHFQKAPSALSGDLRRIVYQVFSESDADSAFMSWQKWLSKNAAMFSRKPGENLVNGVLTKALNKDPNIVLRSARDAVLGALILKKGVDPVPMPTGVVPRTTEYLYTRVARNQIPSFAGISVDLQLKDPRNPYLLRLRRGEDLGFSSFVFNIMNKKISSSKEGNNA